jgi:hypothetical protein
VTELPDATEDRRPHVVLVYTSRPPVVVLAGIQAIRSAGGRVTLIGPRMKGIEGLGAEADRVILLRKRAAPVWIDPSNRPARWTFGWASVVVRNRWRRAASGPMSRPLGAPTNWWLALRRDRDAVRAVDDADVITAIDAGAIYSAWRCARRNRDAAVVNGINPTLEHLQLVD